MVNSNKHKIIEKDALLRLFCNSISLALLEQRSTLHSSNVNFETLEESTEELYKFLDKNFETAEFNTAIKPINDLLDKYEATQQILHSILTAIDIDNKPFKVHFEDKEFILKHLDLIIKTSYKKNLPFNRTLEHTDIRFCVVYSSLNGYFKDVDKGRIVDIPQDIFKFLRDNNYPEELFKAILENNFNITYNFVEAFRKILTSGKNFDNKKDLIGNTDINLLNAIKEKYNPVEPVNLYLKYGANFGIKKLDELDDYCLNLNLNKDTLIYRILYKGMSSDKAIDLAEQDYEQYKIGYQCNEESKYFSLKNLFYTICREYTQQN